MNAPATTTRQPLTSDLPSPRACGLPAPEARKNRFGSGVIPELSFIPDDEGLAMLLRWAYADVEAEA